jgi:hypothetical protein
MANKYAHLKAKARELRQRGFTLPEIVDFLKLPKTTVYEWIKDVEIDVKRLRAKHYETYSDAKRERDKQNALRFAKKREEAYEEAKKQAPELLKNPLFRDFINMYLGEGSKRQRNSVALANSDASVMRLAHYWIKQLTTAREIQYFVQIHADHDEKEIKAYWGEILNIDPNIVKIQRKSNSSQLEGRKFRSIHGVFTIRVNDTYFHSKIQGWMDYLRKQWVDLQ